MCVSVRVTAHLLLYMFDVLADVLLGAVQEALGLPLASAEHEHVHGCEAGLPPCGDEHQHGLLGRVAVDGVVQRLGHRKDAGGGVADVVSLNVQLQGGGAHIGVEVEEGV